MAIEVSKTYKDSYVINDLGDVVPKILIGGKTDKHAPNLNMSFECASGLEKYFINLNRNSVIVVDEKPSLVDGSISLSIGNESDIWHIDENGKLKWDIEFQSKPKSNTFEWSLTHSPELVFYYQPKELSATEIERGATRPPNVFGSYAVYCDRAGDYLDSNGDIIVSYKTGKLCHIYRPLCKDANGVETWADLLIENGKLTITIPKVFLNTAEYPVTLDPTLGYSTEGGSSTPYNGGDSYHDTTDGDGGTMSALHAWLKNTSGTEYSVEMAVYTDDTGNNRPQAMVTPAVQIAVPAPQSSLAEYNVAYTGTVAASTKYWLAIITENANNPEYGYDAADANRECYNPGFTWAGGLEDPWPDAGSNYAYRASIWAVYAAAGGVGWTGKICGVINPSKICGVAVANISKVNGV